MILEENYRLKDTIIELTSRIETLKGDLLTLISPQDIFTLQNRELDKELSNIEVIIEYLKGDIEGYKSWIQSLEEERKYLHKQQLNLEEDDNRYKESIADFQLLKESQHQHEVLQFEQRITQLQEDLVKAQRIITGLQKDKSNLNQQVDQLEEETKNYVYLLMVERKNTQMKSQQLSDRVRDHSKMMQDQIKRHRDEIKVYQYQHMQALEQANGSYEEKIRYLNESLQEKNETILEKDKNIQELNLKLKYSFEKLEDEKKENEKKLNDLLIQIDQHKISMKQVLERCDKYLKQKQEATKIQEQLQLENSKLKSTIEDQSDTIKKLNIKVSNLEEKIKKQKEQHQRLIEQLKKDHEQELAKQKEEFDIFLENKLEAQANENKKVMIQLESKRLQEINKLNKKINSLEKSMDTKALEYDKTINNYKKQITDNQKQYDQKISTLEAQYSIQLEEKQKYLSKIEISNQSLLNQLQTIEKKHDEEKMAIIQRYQDMIKQKTFEENEFAAKVRKPHLETIEYLNTKIKDFEQEIIKKNTKLTYCEKSIEELKKEIITQAQNQQQLTNDFQLFAKQQLDQEKLVQIKQQIDLLNERKGRMINTIQQQQFQIKKDQEKIEELKAVIEENSKNYKEEQLYQYDQKMKLEKQIWTLTMEVKDQKQIVQQHSETIDKQKYQVEHHDEILQAEKEKLNQTIKSLEKQIFKHKEIRLRQAQEISQFKKDIEAKQQELIEQENTFMKRLDQAHSSHQEEIRIMEAKQQEIEDHFKNNFDEIIQKAKMDAIQQKQEEIFKLTAKYESQLSIAKRQLHALPNGDRLDQISQELTREKEEKEQLDDQIKKQNQEYTSYINDLNQKFNVIYQQMKEDNDELQQSKMKLTEKCNNLEMQLNQTNEEVIKFKINYEKHLKIELEKNELELQQLHEKVIKSKEEQFREEIQELEKRYQEDIKIQNSVIQKLKQSQKKERLDTHEKIRSLTVELDTCKSVIDRFQQLQSNFNEQSEHSQQQEKEKEGTPKKRSFSIQDLNIELPSLPQFNQGSDMSFTAVVVNNNQQSAISTRKPSRATTPQTFIPYYKRKQNIHIMKTTKNIQQLRLSGNSVK